MSRDHRNKSILFFGTSVFKRPRSFSESTAIVTKTGIWHLFVIIGTPWHYFVVLWYAV
jgi:predicted membrane channel-forming protein YqfA (hemolysin III family)